MKQEHFVIYSHGFGVGKDDRGLFTDIATALPSAEHILFDYNEVNEAANTLTIAPLGTQAQKLLRVIADTKTNYPGATIDLICHSQGCFVAGMAQPEGVRKTMLIAPTAAFSDTENKVIEWCAEQDVEFTKHATMQLHRRDGSTTILPPEYWRTGSELDGQDMYNLLAQKTSLTIIEAAQDEVLNNVRFNQVDPKVKAITLDGGHNFDGQSRAKLCALIIEELD